MKINWKIRFRSQKFWLFLIGFVGTLATAILPRMGIAIDINGWESWLDDVVTIIFLGLTGLGIVVDPTTPKISDSDRVKSYSVKSKNQQLQDQVSALEAQLLEQQATAEADDTVTTVQPPETDDQTDSADEEAKG